MVAPSCILWENELLHFYAYSLIKYTYYWFGNTEIGTQTLQKRKSWEVRAWELVGTEFPRWGAIAHLSLDPLIYIYMGRVAHKCQTWLGFFWNFDQLPFIQTSCRRLSGCRLKKSLSLGSSKNTNVSCKNDGGWGRTTADWSKTQDLGCFLVLHAFIPGPRWFCS